MQYDKAKELYDETYDILENGLDDIREHFDSIETHVYHGETGPKKDRTEDDETLDSITDENITSFDEIQANLETLIARLTALRNNIRGAIE